MNKTHAIANPRPSLWRQWLHKPKHTWLRRLVFQIHLWLGIILGAYVVAVCVSGSAIVFRNDIYDWLESGGRSFSYKPALYHWLSWLGKLHGSLFLESEGMMANAIGGFLLALLCVTGIVVWWPGLERWRRALTIHRDVGWKRFMVDLHGALGLWSAVALLMWGLTGGYFVFPQPFRAAVNFFAPINPPQALPPAFAASNAGSQAATPSASPPRPFPRRRPPPTLGAKILRGFSFAHYGNFAGWGVKTLWVLLGLTPAVLYGSALVMWYNRVLAPAARRIRSRG